MLAYAAAVVVLVTGTERLVLHPIVTRLNDLDEEIVVKEHQLRRNLREVAARQVVGKAYARHAAYARTARSDEQEMARLLNEIEGLATSSGLSVVNMKPRPAGKLDVRKEYPVELEVETDMARLVRFLHGLHASTYLLRVKQMRLVPKGGRSTQVSAYLLISETVLQ